MAAGLLLTVPAAIFLVCGLVALVALSLTARPDSTLPSEVASARRHGLVTSVLAQVAFVATMGLLIFLATRPSTDGVRPTPLWLGALPLIGAIAALVVLMLGELTWPRPRGVRRQVNLNPRTLRDLVPRLWARVLLAMGGLTVAVIGLGWWAADPSGHALQRGPHGDIASSGASPFPGSDYGLPQLVTLAVALPLLYGALRLATLRPAVVRSDVATDNRLRAASTVRAIRVMVSALAFTCGGNLFFGGATGARLYDAGWQQSIFIAAMLLGLVLGVAGIGLVLAPAPRLPRTDPADAPGAHTTTSA